MREPAFWWRPAGFAATALSPIATIYGAVAARRMRQPGIAASVPVICVGNFTLGGSGKTPAVIALAKWLQQAGHKPVLLSRGYGGSLAGPVRVDPTAHGAAEVGDEALLLAQAAPTVVARDRVAGAALAREAGADVIVMDDGLQNPSLRKTLSIAVVDGTRGIGNGKVFPAGPLRAPLAAQIGRTDALLVVDNGFAAAPVAALAETQRRPVFHGRLVPDRDAIAALRGRGVLAFAGIGNPDRFFQTLRNAGIDVAQHAAFPDHHRFSAEEAGDLIMRAEHDGLRLVTTAKDRARMAGDPALDALAQRARVLPVEMQIDDGDAWQALVLRAIG
jgi:tetraacyldisaccharide 4'-kinase